MKKIAVVSILVLNLLFIVFSANAEVTYKPFILASQTAEDAGAKLTSVKSALVENGFDVVGSYSPYEGVTIIAITNEALKKNAAASGNDDDLLGGFGAAQRVALTYLNGEVQVSYTNPVYMHYVYNLKDLTVMNEVKDQLSLALGAIKEFGPREGLSADDLEDYSYTPVHSDFNDPDELVKYDSYQAALKAVESGLAASKGGTSRVYRIDIPGKNQTLFGVGMTQKVSSDALIMKEIDFKQIRSSAHLPYELLVADNKVFALNASFRIAISFPDLSMMGDNSFMNIMDAPGDIESALTEAAGGKP